MSVSDPLDYSAEQLADEERRLQLPQLDQGIAVELGLLLLRTAQERNLAIAIGIDLGEHRVFQAGLPGTSADHEIWLTRKFAAVRRFDRCSLELERRVQADPEYLTERGLAITDFAMTGGAFPLRVTGVTAGVVGASGLLSVEDHEFVVEGLTHALNAA